MAGFKVGIVPVTPFQQNCTLIWDPAGKTGVVIDPGGDVAEIDAAIERAGFTVTALWLTHGHLDHAGGANALKDQLNAKRPEGMAPVQIIGPDRRDEPLCASIAEQGKMFGLKDLQNAAPDRWLTEGEQVFAGPYAFDVLHCPGHTPGHVVYVCKAARFAQVGDVLFQGSVGRTDFPYGNHQELIDAIMTKLIPLGDDVRFVCGHGPASSFGQERRTNPFLS
jgi:glyoxylase-like metal-dependent hydrolase (beta-lactamase superfamily II)